MRHIAIASADLKMCIDCFTSQVIHRIGNLKAVLHSSIEFLRYYFWVNVFFVYSEWTEYLDHTSSKPVELYRLLLPNRLQMNGLPSNCVKLHRGVKVLNISSTIVTVSKEYTFPQWLQAQGLSNKELPIEPPNQWCL